MKNILPLLMLGLVSVSAQANYGLALNGKAVTCYGEDNMSFKLNAKRTTVKYTVEGESNGPQKVTEVQSDDATYSCYTTSEGLLCLNDEGDTFFFNGEGEPTAIECK